jgi:serine/threonine-protein kinase HipA
MVNRVDVAYIRIWDQLAGAVLWDNNKGTAVFEFDSQFLKNNLDLAPLTMPMAEAKQGNRIYSFPELPKNTFKGLPGLLADSLPDRFGNQIINAWLARQGRTPDSFTPVERLCYTGKRGMGALEFQPIINSSLEKSVPLEISELMELAQTVINQRQQLKTDFTKTIDQGLLDIIRVGTSAGGNRPKAVIAVNEQTGEVRSGQITAPPHFGYWVIKFDGIHDQSLGDPAGYGKIEYAYYQMAVNGGIAMNECRLLEENGRSHFMTRRFDRDLLGNKIHMQSLCAIAHFDFNSPGAYSYEQAFQVMRELRLPYPDAEQLFRRMVFNVIARNQDDHTKNIAFLMDNSGVWRLSPAYDVIYSYNPQGDWTSRHQMSINGKQDHFSKDDLLQVAHTMNIKSAKDIIEQITAVVAQWPAIAGTLGIPPNTIRSMTLTHRQLT